MSSADRPFPWVGLVTLATAIFVLVTSEFLPTGLLPVMARDLAVTESQIGLLITIFAGTVVVSAAPLAALTRHYSRKSLLLAVLAVFALANVLAAIAPSYELLIGARVLGGLAHGLFWAIAGAYAGHLVPRHQLARAVAVTSAGGTTAFVLGVPLGTALGIALGWRAAFGVIAAVVVVLVVLVIRFLPAVDHRVTLATGEIKVPVRRDPTMPSVLFICLLVVIIVTGHNVFYTYIAPFVLDTAGFAPEALSILLFLYGGAGAIGLVLAGVVGGRYLRGGLYGMLAGVILAVSVLALFAGVPVVVVIAFVVWGAAFGGLPTLLQTRLLQVASPNVRDVGAALLTTSFNIGIGGGAAIGAVLFSFSGTTWLPWVEAGALALAILALIIMEARRRARGVPLVTRPIAIVEAESP
ncbi:MFS transporter [Microcella humidisoli]|uniref:MFS transporter n=1 Tax=Microcella humidisoli TaxID=2963406 RepID=A0ABY5FT47_9MICO|nr:MFS transporter [Microcella humidisoli]UTT61464.1 MFS transporter [Microcella humidisoli]